MSRGLEVRLLATMGGCLGRLRENFLTLIFFFLILPVKDDELVMSEM